MRVTIVEDRNASGNCVAHVASSMEKAIAFIKANADYQESPGWYWAVWEEEVDCQEILEVDGFMYYDRHGNASLNVPV